MHDIVFAAFCAIASVTALALPYAILSLWEMQAKLKLLSYSVSLAFYQDLVMQLRTRTDVTPEEEFGLAVLQDQLTRQAEAIGIDFKPFQRPQGLSAPE